ncbi:unnamed protein product [Lathyrus oleraceus]
MSNKVVTLLLVVFLVTVQGQHISIKYGEVVVPPDECYRYCIAASLYPSFMSNRICKFRCYHIVMWESFNGSHTRRQGPVGAPTGSPAPAPYTQRA